jgi:hypothetical protein
MSLQAESSLEFSKLLYVQNSDTGNAKWKIMSAHSLVEYPTLIREKKLVFSIRMFNFRQESLSIHQIFD